MKIPASASFVSANGPSCTCRPPSRRVTDVVAAKKDRLAWTVTFAVKDGEAYPKVGAPFLFPHLRPDGVYWVQAVDTSAKTITFNEEMGPAKNPRVNARFDALVQQFTQGRTLGFLGEPRVDVLNLNIALDQKFPFGH